MSEKDEFTKARDEKVRKQLLDLARELKKSQPKPKDLPRPRITTKDRDQ